MTFEKVLVTGAGGLLGGHVVDLLKGRCAVSGFDLGKRRDDIPMTEGDVTDPAAVARAVAGCDAVVHIAAVPNIWSAPPDRIMAINVLGTWNVFRAAEEAGVRRVIFCSSDSVSGFTVMSGKMRAPVYLPIDEQHPLQATDPYATSKILGENIGRSFAYRGIEVVAIRPVFVLYSSMHGEAVARAKDPRGYKGPAAGGHSPAGGGAMWHYVDPRDAARAFGLALALPAVQFEAFYISGPNTLAPDPTLDRFRAFAGSLPEVRRPEVYRSNPFAPLYDMARPRDRLGYVPEHDLRHLVEPIYAGHSR